MTVLDQARETIESPPERELYKNFGLVKAWLAEQVWPGNGERPIYALRTELSPKKIFIVFQSDMSEFSPNTQFPDFQREIAIMSSGDTVQDWDSIIEPSLIERFGETYPTKIFNEDGSAKPFYAQWENVPRSDGMTSQKGNVYTVPSFLAIYSSSALTQAALDQIKGGGNSTNKVDLSELVEEAKQLAIALGAKERGSVFGAMKESGRLAALTGEQINDVFTQAGL